MKYDVSTCVVSTVCVASGRGDGCTALRLHAELMIFGAYVDRAAGIETLLVCGGIFTSRFLGG